MKDQNKPSSSHHIPLNASSPNDLQTASVAPTSPRGSRLVKSIVTTTTRVRTKAVYYWDSEISCSSPTTSPPSSPVSDSTHTSSLHIRGHGSPAPSEEFSESDNPLTPHVSQDDLSSVAALNATMANARISDYSCGSTLNEISSYIPTVFTNVPPGMVISRLSSSEAKTKGKVYTVSVGRQVGIFANWAVVANVTSGVPHQSQQGHRSVDAAEYFFQDALNRGAVRIVR